MSTFYAVFNDPARARMAVMALLDQGVPTDDISLVSRKGEVGFGTPSRLEDASSFVGSPDDPERDELTRRPNAEEAQYVATESPIGMGVSSAEPNDSAESADQSDDSQWLAEDDIELGLDVTQAEQEVHDLDLAVNTGFPTSTDEPVRYNGEAIPVSEALKLQIEEIAVPGFGVVIGSGPLATAALDYGDGDPSDDVEEMMRHFREEGVSDDFARTYLSALDQGEALLAVGLIPGEVDPPLIETVAERFGGQDAATFDAPRY